MRAEMRIHWTESKNDASRGEERESIHNWEIGGPPLTTQRRGAQNISMQLQFRAAPAQRLFLVDPTQKQIDISI